MPMNKEENTVLLVMDHSDQDVMLITCLLEKTGFEVFRSVQKVDILNFCRAADQAVHLVIINVATPGIQIAELLEQVQAVNARIRVILISGPNQPEPAGSWSARTNVYGRLGRPFRRAQFLGSVLEAAREPLVRTA